MINEPLNVKPIRFEYKKYPTITVVALGAALSQFEGQPVIIDSKPFVKYPERTEKDCRYIDGRVYLHLGKVSDQVMCDMIEKFLKLLNDKDWKKSKDGVYSIEKVVYI